MQFLSSVFIITQGPVCEALTARDDRTVLPARGPGGPTGHQQPSIRAGSLLIGTRGVFSSARRVPDSRVSIYCCAWAYYKIIRI